MQKLSDQNLEKVSGGGSGTLPPEGLTYTPHSGISCGYFYADANKSSNIIFAWGIVSNRYIQYYKLKLEVNGSNWRILEDKALINNQDEISYLSSQYPYLLNILP